MLKNLSIPQIKSFSNESLELAEEELNNFLREKSISSCCVRHIKIIDKSRAFERVWILILIYSIYLPAAQTPLEHDRENHPENYPSIDYDELDDSEMFDVDID